VYKPALIISLLLSSLPVLAQDAEDYFHGGAQSYIWGDKEKASTQIFQGLEKYPTNALLNGMAAILMKQEEKQQQQQKNQQQQQNQKDQKQNEQKGDSQSQSNQSQDKSNKDKQDQKKNDQKKDEQSQAQQAKEEKEKQEKEQQAQQAQAPQGQPNEKEQEENEKQYAAGEMTPQQAQQLLDAQKGDEKLIPPQSKRKPQDSSRPIRDW
jgi:hypothetical protein